DAAALSESEFRDRYPNLFLLELQMEAEDDSPRKREVHSTHRLTSAALSTMDLPPGGGLARLFVLVQKRADDILVGRSPLCDIRIEDERVSSRHCAIKKGPRDLWLLTDLASTNGTTINGRTVPVGVPLPFKPGSLLGFGLIMFKLLEATQLRRLFRTA